MNLNNKQTKVGIALDDSEIFGPIVSQFAAQKQLYQFNQPAMVFYIQFKSFLNIKETYAIDGDS